MKYKFQALYELDSLAVVNARDVANCKNAFKILMFPDSRMFQAENAKEKVRREWGALIHTHYTELGLHKAKVGLLS